VEIFSQSVTPTDGSGNIIISGHISYYQSTAQPVAVCLFIDSATNAEQVNIGGGGNTSGQGNGLNFAFKVAAGSTSARTYKIRVGQASGTNYVNRSTVSGLYGSGKLSSYMQIVEV
jgi:hypothetical protein